MTGPHASGECRAHASALLDLADPRVVTPASTAATDHLEWCRSCSEELQDLGLTIVAMRRFGAVSTVAPKSPATWPRLAARIQATRVAAAASAWRWRASVAGLAAGALIVAAVVAPLALDVQVAGGTLEPTGLSPAEVEALARRAEATYIWQSGAGALFEAPARGTATETGPRRYPDDIVPQQKEVPVRTTGLLPKAD